MSSNIIRHYLLGLLQVLPRIRCHVQFDPLINSDIIEKTPDFSKLCGLYDIQNRLKLKFCLI